MNFGYGPRIEAFTRRVSCVHDFKCAASGVENLRKVNGKGRKDILACLADDPRDCPFVLLSDGSHVCQCPLRKYMAEHLTK